MDRDTKQIAIPVVGISVAIVLYLVIILLFVVEGEEIGSVAEWIAAFGGIVVGLVAAGFAAVAWKASERATAAAEQATEWARIAAEAQQQANALTEAELLPTIIVRLEDATTSTGRPVPVPLITINLKEESPAPIWVQAFTAEIAVLYDADTASIWIRQDLDEHEPFNDTLPTRILPTQGIAEPDPYHQIYAGRVLSLDSFANYSLTYSFTKHGPQHTLEHQPINLDARTPGPQIHLPATE